VGIIAWALWGLFVGIIARLLLPGRHRIGIILTLVLGVTGSLLGGFLATEVLDIADADDFDFGSFLIAVATSVLLLGIVDRVQRALPDKKRDELEPGRR
jgi:uncharacterized membrane protein YeaQ/YmgE (transglycosylase-associated protein family)